jgi:SAM-dependent methyltransferase
MHPSVMAFASEAVDHYALRDLTVLEVGSYNVNGTVRDLFAGPYLGVDMRPGPGVDEVCNSRALRTLGRTFDVVVSTEMLEHDPLPWVSIRQMADVLHPGGILLLTARGYDERGCFPVHDYPDDLWRFSVEGIVHLLTGCGFDVLEAFSDPEEPGVFAVGRKP